MPDDSSSATFDSKPVPAGEATAVQWKNGDSMMKIPRPVSHKGWIN